DAEQRPSRLVAADWASVLYYGTTDAAETAVIAQQPAKAPATIDAAAAAAAAAADPVRTPPARSHLPRRVPGAATAGTGEQRRSILEDLDFFTVFQPIRELESDDAVGFEALTRFADGRSPDAVLAEAQAQDQAGELDAALVRSALSAAAELPEDVWVSINVSASLAARPDLLVADLAASPRPVVIEFVADTREDPGAWIAALPPHVSIAVDDAGAGYDSLALVESLRPAFMKLDRTTVTGIEIDAARQAFVGTLVAFAEEHGCQVIAEGVETAGERQALVDAGVHLGQGYLLGRPMPVERTHEATHPRAALGGVGAG
ncbi:MAG: EAL domain-containing protein, partial [Microthrixaceae bacterium]